MLLVKEVLWPSAVGGPEAMEKSGSTPWPKISKDGWMDGWMDL